jgi:protease I
MKVIMLTADGYEDMELFYPYWRLVEEQISVDVASYQSGIVTGTHGYQMNVDKTIDQINPDSYDFLIIPGGSRAAAIMSQNDRAVFIAQKFFTAKKPIAAICHGPQILIAADILRGKRVTCDPRLAGAMRSAGAIYQDSEVVVDGNLITSRKPYDLPVFTRAIMVALRQVNWLKPTNAPNPFQ